MNKTDFAGELAKRTNIPRNKAIEITNAAIDILTEGIVKKEKIQFIGFGSFETKYTSQRMARNPKTKEPRMIPAGYKPVFKASKTLRCKVNED